MNKKETAQVLAVVTVEYYNAFKGLSKADLKAKLNLWEFQFKSDNYESVSAAVNAHIASNKWPPKISELKALLTEQSFPSLKESAGEAWCSVLNAASEWGRYQFLRAEQDLSPVAAMAARVTGWTRICNSQNVDMLRAHFLKIYKELQERVKVDLQTGQANHSQLIGPPEVKLIEQVICKKTK